MDPETFIFHYRGFQNHAGATVAIIKVDGSYYAGVSLCRKGEEFEPHQGEVKAVGRAQAAKAKQKNLVVDESELSSLAAQILLNYYRGWINRRKALANLRYMRFVTRLHIDEGKILGVGLPGQFIHVREYVRNRPEQQLDDVHTPTTTQETVTQLQEGQQ